MSDLTEGLYLASPAALAEHVSQGRWKRAPHVTFLSDKLVDAAMGHCPRLMVFEPPRHGKSYLVSHWFPVWLLALMPHKRIILASYGDDFAREWGRMVRNTIAENWPELQIEIAEDSKAAFRWNTAEGGGMVTAGVGGPITGRGADILIIDDPVKDGEEAKSEAVQERNWNWWKTTARTRVEPGGVVIVMQTRWHEEDLAGKLLQAYKGGPGTEGYEDWQIVRLPALAEENDQLGRKVGQALWPARYDEAELGRIKTSVGSKAWAALYQQRPSPEEGGLIKRAWFRRYDELPANLDKILFSWDCTFKDADESDFVVGQAWGLRGAECFLLDQVRGQWDITVTIKQLRALRSKWLKLADKILREPNQIHRTVVEDKANGPAVVSTLRHEIPGLMAWPPKGQKMSSKESRVAAVSPLLEAGQVYFPNGQAFVETLVEEAAAFPNGSNDDQVDCMSQALLNLQPKLWNPAEKQPEKPKNLADMRAQEMARKIAEYTKPQDTEETPTRYRYL